MAGRTIAVETGGCRTCGGNDLERLIDFGLVPIADRLVRPEWPAEEDPLAPLSVTVCRNCWLMQIAETVPPDELFGEDYLYFSSVSQTLLEHSRAHAEELMALAGLSPESLVVELASNDGYLLENFRGAGIPHLGIDPAPGPAKAAIERGIDTWVRFFDTGVAREVVAKRGEADVVIANNVLAHVADVHGFVDGIAAMLKPEGRVRFEFPYAVELMANMQFDTIYHQHLCYFSLHSVSALLERHGLTVTDVWALPIHGGSLRVEARKTGEPSERVTAMRGREVELGMTGTGPYRDFAGRVKALRDELVAAVEEAAARGHRLAAYGAAAKGTTLLAYCGFDSRTFDFVADRNKAKHGWLMPGSRLYIVPAEALETEKPDLVLLLTWNFASEILKQQAAYLEAGGKFLIPIPHPRIAELTAA